MARKNNHVYSVILMLVWAGLHTATMSLAKVLTGHVSIFMMVFARSLFGFMWLMPLIYRTGIKKTFVTPNLPWHILRGFLVCGALASTYYAYGHLDMTLATTIGFSQPLFICILAILLLKEKMTASQWLALLIGYVGVVVAVNPFGAALDPTIFVALLANFLAACSIITARKLTATDKTITLMVYVSLMLVIVSGITASFFWKMPTNHELMILCILGGIATLSQFCYMKALEYGEASFVAPFEYSRLVFAIPVSMLFFGESPAWVTFMGAGIIIACNFFVAKVKS